MPPGWRWLAAVTTKPKWDSVYSTKCLGTTQGGFLLFRFFKDVCGPPGYHLHRLIFKDACPRITTSQHLLQRTSGARSAGQAEAVQAATAMHDSSFPALPVINLISKSGAGTPSSVLRAGFMPDLLEPSRCLRASARDTNCEIGSRFASTTDSQCAESCTFPTHYGRGFVQAAHPKQLLTQQWPQWAAWRPPFCLRLSEGRKSDIFIP